MKISEFIELVASGSRPVIQFGAGIEDFEVYAEARMRAQVMGVGERSGDAVALKFDFSAFDEHNKSFESSNYYDAATGRHDKTAREKGYYHVQDSIYFSDTDELPHVFKVVDDFRLSLFNSYVASGSKLSYTTWLEDELIKTRPA